MNNKIKFMNTQNNNGIDKKSQLVTTFKIDLLKNKI